MSLGNATLCKVSLGRKAKILGKVFHKKLKKFSEKA